MLKPSHMQRSASPEQSKPTRGSVPRVIFVGSFPIVPSGKAMNLLPNKDRAVSTILGRIDTRIHLYIITYSSILCQL